MRKLTSGLLASTAAAALTASLVTPAGAAMRGDAPSQTDQPGSSAAHRQDDRPGPLTKQQRALRQLALEKLDTGKATKRAQRGGGSTVTVTKGKTVELFDNNKQARILSILSEFGDQVVGKYGGTPGPIHNQIPKPVPSKDNSTTWASDFDQAHYDQMFNGDGESFKSFYRDLSGGQYSADGTVEDWVKVPYNAAYYGSNPREDNGGAWDFINDTGDSWYAKKLADLGSKKAVDDFLSQFDQWDRYDYNHNGDFNEPDGYIDHFQAIHAGEGEEAGASPDAIWSHRWYVYGNQYGVTGPTVNGTANLLGGAQVGESSYYIGDYTVEPENGGLGVFAHEYGHDLGLPDFYDTAGGENSTAFWTLMSSGSWLSHGGTDGIGTTPGLMGPDERRSLGWLDYATVQPGGTGTFTLRPAGQTKKSSNPQAVKVQLPEDSKPFEYTTPADGSQKAWWSGRGDNLSNTLTRKVSGASSVTVTADAWYSIEQGYDYLYGEYSTDDGKTWKSAGKAVTGDSNRWTGLRWSYKANGAATVFRFRYQTDGGVNEPGAFLDNITVKAADTVVDDAEHGDLYWTPDGWTTSTGSGVVTAPRYYLLENRAYVGYDKTLQEGPYNFSEAYSRPNWVEFFPFQDGMLVWYADKLYSDNNTSEHEGFGQALPVDARPEPFVYEADGTTYGRPSNRRQPFDATFGLEAPDPVCLHKEVLVGTKQDPQTKTVTACPSAPAAIATFDDSVVNRYYSADNPQGSTKVAGLGVTATVTDQSRDLLTVDVDNTESTPAG